MRTARYVRAWKNRQQVAVDEIEVQRDELTLPASFVKPNTHRGDLPGWIILGGVTSMGRFHPQLIRFAHSLAASGAGVMVPEIPEWRDLRLAPGVTLPTVRAAIQALDARPEIAHGKYGLVGFSFGAPQAVIAANHPEMAHRIGMTVTFGGYCDLERTVRCQLTGLHEWEGVTHRIEPDPYGRYVIASNYLTNVLGCDDATDVAEALRLLALASTENRTAAWDPVHDTLKDDLREKLPDSRKELFDLFAPSSTVPVESCDLSETMAIDLAGACRRTEPLLDPAHAFQGARVPAHIFHGRGDRLVPYTESLRFRARLPEDLSAQVTVTGLFAHSADHRPASLGTRVSENIAFLRALSRILVPVH